MQRFLSSILCFAVAVTLVMPPPAAAALSKGAALQVAVVPVVDGDADGQSAKLALAIGDALRLATPHHIIDSKLSAELLQYNDGPRAKEAGEDGGAAAALARAKERYFQFRYDEAKAELDRAIAALEARPEAISALGEKLLDAYVTRAVIAKSRGDAAEMCQALSAALAIDPRLDLAAEEYPPSLLAALEEERGKINVGAPATIAIATRPEVADVLVNGIRRGVTPIEMELPAGSYRLLIRANRYADIERTVVVAAGKRVALRERLKWAEGDSLPRPPAADAASEVSEGLRIADILKADKVILIDAGAGAAGEQVSARVVDRSLRAGQPPIAVDVKGGAEAAPEALAKLTERLAAQVAAGGAIDPARDIDPKGMADPALLNKRKRPLLKSPVFWGVVGAILAGGLGGGLAAALSGGSGDRGSVRVEFR